MKSHVPKIIIENGAFSKIPTYVKKVGSAFTIITDANLRSRGEELRKRMKKSKLPCSLLIIPPGEQTKTLSFVEKIAKSLVNLGLKRDGCIIALGGGVVGDVAGFVASIFLRGIAYVSVPTTLLAMGDSSIGGKTGVDLAEGKNLIGTFYHPKIIIMDPLFLRDLPDRDFRSGMAEVIKHAIIADKTFFAFLEKNSGKILVKNPELLKKMVTTSAHIKLNIVKKDERESIQRKAGEVSRMLVNYGHTVGHALEKLSGFTLRHGEAVSIGMVAENRIAVGEKLLSSADAERIASLLKKYGLPTKIPPQYGAADINKHFATDKKHIGGKLHFALPKKIGQATVVAFTP